MIVRVAFCLTILCLPSLVFARLHKRMDFNHPIFGKTSWTSPQYQKHGPGLDHVKVKNLHPSGENGYIPFVDERQTHVLLPERYILVESAAYMYVAQQNYNDAYVVYIWNVNEACPGYYWEIFQGLENVMFIKEESRQLATDGALVSFSKTNEPFPQILAQNRMGREFGYLHWENTEKELFQKFVPNNEIMLKVSNFVRLHDVCSAAAMHLRMTGAGTTVNTAHLRGRAGGESIDTYHKYMDNTHDKVFLMTNYPSIQQEFLSKYGADKIVFYAAVESDGGWKGVSADGGSAIDTQVVNGHEIAHHHVDVMEYLLIDILIAAHAKQFHPTRYSSVSETVHSFARVGRASWGWCSN